MAASLSQAVESGPAQAQPLPDLTEVSKVSSASESDATAAHNATSQDLDLEHHQKEGVDRADDVEKQQSNTPAAPVSGPPPGDGILTGLPLYLAFTGMMLSIFLIALDQTILASALPKILTAFTALEDITWVSSGYILAQTALMAPAGQICFLYTPKIIFLAAIVVFEVGSVICGAAPSVDVLIFGRTIAGAGAAFLMVSMITLMTEIVPLAKRPAYMGLFGSVFGIASVVGPLLGGAFSDHVTWRLCFYINLPFGVIAFIFVFFLVKSTKSQAYKRGDRRTALQRVVSVDWGAIVLLLAMVTCLVLGTTWGSTTKSWKDGSVIACLVIGGLLFPVVLVYEHFLGEKAAIPLSLFKNRSYGAIVLQQFTSRWIMLVPTYYLPVYFEAVLNHSATKAGLDLLGLILSLVVASMIIGIVVKKTGKYLPFLFLGPMLCAVGGGLLWTLEPGTKFGKVIGFEIILGVGIGAFFQLGMLAAQAEFAKQPHLTGRVMGVSTFSQMLGGVVGLAISGAVFADKLDTNLNTYAPGVNHIVASSPTDIRKYVSGEELANVILSYTRALRWVYVILVPLAGAAAIFAIGIKQRPLSQGPPQAGKPADKSTDGQGKDPAPTEKQAAQPESTAEKGSPA